MSQVILKSGVSCFKPEMVEERSWEEGGACSLLVSIWRGLAGHPHLSSADKAYRCQEPSLSYKTDVMGLLRTGLSQSSTRRENKV